MILKYWVPAERAWVTVDPGGEVTLPTKWFVLQPITFDQLRDNPGKGVQIKHLVIERGDTREGYAIECDGQAYLLNNDGKTIERL